MQLNVVPMLCELCDFGGSSCCRILLLIPLTETILSWKLSVEVEGIYELIWSLVVLSICNFHFTDIQYSH